MDYDLFRVTVYGFIVNNKNELLIVQRAPHDSFPGYWELPGGSLEAGETLEDGVLREIMEEAGILVDVIRPLAANNISPVEVEKRVIRIIYYCRTLSETDITLSEEHSQFAWVNWRSISHKPLTKSLRFALTEASDQKLL